jgi:hypothetical protein
MGGIKFISTFSLNNSILISALSLMAPVLYGFPFIDVRLAFIAIVLLSLFFFTFPLYDLHVIMRNTKHKELNTWGNIFETQVGGIRTQTQEKGQTIFQHTETPRLFWLSRAVFLEIEKMKEWPINIEMVGKLVGPTIVSIFLSFLAKYIGQF